MYKTTTSNNGAQKITVDIHGLQEMLSIGINSARAVGRDAGAEINIGKRKLYNVDKVREYVNKLTEV